MADEKDKSAGAPKIEDVIAPEPTVDLTPAENGIMLDEFCTRLSQSDGRVELIGGFHHTETVSGAFRDTEANYASRFLAFADRPA